MNVVLYVPPIQTECTYILNPPDNKIFDIRKLKYYASYEKSVLSGVCTIYCPLNYIIFRVPFRSFYLVGESHYFIFDGFFVFQKIWWCFPYLAHERFTQQNTDFKKDKSFKTASSIIKKTSNLSSIATPQLINLKGQCHETDILFEGLNILISTFCVCADSFQGILKAFQHSLQSLTIYLLLWNYLLILKMLIKTLLRIPFSLISRCSPVPTSHWLQWKCARINL